MAALSLAIMIRNDEDMAGQVAQAFRLMNKDAAVLILSRMPKWSLEQVLQNSLADNLERVLTSVPQVRVVCMTQTHENQHSQDERVRSFQNKYAKICRILRKERRNASPWAAAAPAADGLGWNQMRRPRNLAFESWTVLLGRSRASRVRAAIGVCNWLGARRGSAERCTLGP